MSSDPIVRPFVAGDLQDLMSFLHSALTALGHEFLPDGKDSDIREIETAYLADRGAFFVLATSSGIQGCVGVRRLSDQAAELKRLYLSEDLRGRGLGRELCAVAIEESRRLGYAVLRLDTTRRAVAALGLFRKLGFQEIPRYNDDRFAEIFMEKVIIANQAAHSKKTSRRASFRLPFLLEHPLRSRRNPESRPPQELTSERVRPAEFGPSSIIPMQYQIREAQTGDAETIAQLIHVLGYDLGSAEVLDRLKAYRSEISKAFVACHDAGLVGFLSYHAIPLFHEAAMLGRITAMAIDPHHQREGIGSALVKAAEHFAASIGCSRMEVTSGDRRAKDAHLFYAGQGYRADCRRFLKHLPDTANGGRCHTRDSEP